MECSVDGCGRVRRRRSLCRRHYQEGLANGTLERVRHPNTGKTCRASKCFEPAVTRGLCGTDYARLQRSGWDESVLEGYQNPVLLYVNPDGTRKPCKVDGCENPASSKSICTTHRSQRQRGISDEDLYIPGQLFPCPVHNCENLIGRRARMCDTHTRTRWLYSLPIDEFIAMYNPENYRCGNLGCGSTEELNLDHDHSCCGYVEHTTKLSCGKCVRGWLCRGCNIALGHLREDPRRIEGLLRYIEGVKQ